MTRLADALERANQIDAPPPPPAVVATPIAAAPVAVAHAPVAAPPLRLAGSPRTARPRIGRRAWTVAPAPSSAPQHAPAALDGDSHPSRLRCAGTIGAGAVNGSG